MATKKQTSGARKNVTKAREAADSKRSRAELYEVARQRDLPGRSNMGRDELARKLGEK
jgi:hypothetical protein